MRTIVTAARLWSPAGIIENPVIEVENGCIDLITATEEPVAAMYSFPGATLAPAFYDIHFHGAAGHDVMEATPKAISAIGALLARHGTASYLATTVTAPLDTTLRSISEIAKLIENPDRIEDSNKVALPIGIHLEGPFLSPAKCGVQPVEHMIAPDIQIFDRLFEAAAGHIVLITIAPELPGAVEMAAYAASRGVRVSLGHSNATAAQTRAAVDAGATSATHTFNAMRALDHREPGILGVALTDDRLFAELICDGIHVVPQMARLFWNTKPEDRAILVTDAMSATGMPDGEYKLGGFAVQVANGRATAHGALAGSVLTQDRALSNFMEFTGAPIDKALRLLTANPATMTGLNTSHLAIGEPANFVAVDASGKLLATFIHGQRIAA